MTNLVTRCTGSMRNALRSILRSAGRSFCSWSRNTLSTSRSAVSWSTSNDEAHWLTQYVSNASNMCVESRKARPTHDPDKRWNPVIISANETKWTLEEIMRLVVLSVRVSVVVCVCVCVHVLEAPYLYNGAK